MTNYPTYKLGELISEAIGGDWGKAPDFLDESYELAYCIRGAEYKNWADDNGSTAVLRKIKYTNLQKRQLKEGDIIVEISGGGPEQPVGRTEVITKRVLSNFKGSKVLCTNFLRLIRPNAELVDAVFLNYYLKFFYSTGEIIKYQAGSNNLRNLKFKDYLNLPIPLPPLPTQHQIVSRIETLFAELDKAAEHLRTAQQQLKTYKQTVLNHWLNNEDGKWEMVKLGEICSVLGDGLHGTPKFVENGDFYFINGNNLNGAIVIKQDTKTTNLEEFEKYKKNLNERTILISINGTLGNIAYYNGEPVVLGKSACYFNLLDGIEKDYVKYCLLSERFRSYALKNATGSTIKNVPLKAMRMYSLPLPPLSEQQRIVKEIETRLSQASTSSAYIENALQQSEALRQSILKKAFSGEFVSAGSTTKMGG